MTETTTRATQTESVDEFAARARKWVCREHAIHRSGRPARRRPRRGGARQRARELQRKLGTAASPASASPREYGGLGLPLAYQRAFDIESRCYEMPIILNTPRSPSVRQTILDMGSEEQKRKHITGVLRGDEGSAAYRSPTAVPISPGHHPPDRRGDKWIINGAKTWSTSAFGPITEPCWPAPTGTCPKHEGLHHVPGADERTRDHVAAHQAGQRVHRVLRRNSSTGSNSVTTP